MFFVSSFFYFFLLKFTLHNRVPGEHGFACVLGRAGMEVTTACSNYERRDAIFPCVSDHQVVHGLNQLLPNA